MQWYVKINHWYLKLHFIWVLLALVVNYCEVWTLFSCFLFLTFLLQNCIFLNVFCIFLVSNAIWKKKMFIMYNMYVNFVSLHNSIVFRNLGIFKLTMAAIMWFRSFVLRYCRKIIGNRSLLLLFQWQTFLLTSALCSHMRIS